MLALTGCELVGDLDARSVDPIVEGCTLPVAGDGRMRVANLRPDAALVDFCVRASGESYARPLLRGGGRACAAGYRYEEVSAPFAVRTGAVDVKMIAAGNPCAAPALAELQNVAVDNAAVVTIASLAAQAGPAQLLALPEESKPDDSQLRLRFLNAMVGAPPLDLGLTDDATLPTQINMQLVSEAVPFAATPKPGTLGVDDHGYLNLPPSPYQLGVAASPASSAFFALSFSERPATYSLFAIGAVADSQFPPRGLLCDETTPAAGLTLSCVETTLARTPDAGTARAASPGLTSLDAGLSTTAGFPSRGASAADGGAPNKGVATHDLLDGATPPSTPAMSTPITSSPETSLADAMVATSPFGLTAQYELNPVAPADIEIAPVLRISNVSSREPIPLKSLTLRYYFTNEHFSECPTNCAVDDYYDNLSLGMTVAATWTYVPIDGKLGYLEVAFPMETASLHYGESVQSFQGFHTSTWLPFDQSDDYSFIPNQDSFVDSQKVTIYRDGVLVWGTPPP